MKVVAELKQNVGTSSSKLRRSEVRTEQYVQNRMLQTNQAKLSGRLEKEKRSNDIRPLSQESVRFWGHMQHRHAMLYLGFESNFRFFTYPILGIRNNLEIKQTHGIVGVHRPTPKILGPHLIPKLQVPP